MASNTVLPSSSSTPPLPVLVCNDRKDEKYFILNKYGEGPATHTSYTGSIGGIPVYRAVKVTGQSTEEEDINKLAVSLKCVYLRSRPESPLDCASLYHQIKNEEGNSRPFDADNSNVLAVKSSFTHTGNDGLEFQCVEFDLIGEGSLHSFLRRFQTRTPEPVILYILGQVVKAVDQIHNTNRLHGMICAAHVFYMGKQEFRLGYAATSVDLNSDMEDMMHRCNVWRWAAAPEITSGVGVPRRDQLKTDIWMLGILALELAYSGLPFSDAILLHHTLDQIRLDGKLPRDLLEAGGLAGTTNTLKGLLKKKKRIFSRGFEGLVFSCLQLEPSRRPSARDLARDEFLMKFQTSVPHKGFF